VKALRAIRYAEMVRMTKRVTFILIWTLLFFLGALFLAAFLLGFSTGALSYYFQGLRGEQDRLTASIYIALGVLSVIAALIGGLLGISGKLPGTKR
jgi:hypothetical protein